MKLINLDDERERRNGPGLRFSRPVDNADVSMMVMPTVDGEIAWLTFPERGEGVLLSPEQAEEMALALLRYKTLIEAGVLDHLKDGDGDGDDGSE